MSNREDQISRLYTAEADHLIATVRRNVHGADDAAIEDACGFAWMALVSRPEIDPSHPQVFSWLATTAIRKAWEMTKRDRREDSIETVTEPTSTAPSVEQQAEDAEILALLDQLKPNERIALELVIAGLSYDEIAEQLGKTRTWVNRYVSEARARLRRLRE